MEERKPTLRELRNRHHFSIAQVKGLSDLPELEIYHMLLNVPVSREIAVRVLENISEITRLPYSLENVEVVLLSNESQEKVSGQTKVLPTIQEIRRWNHITLNMLIEDTQLAPDEVLRADHGIGTEETIDLLLASLSRMVGQNYTKQNVRDLYLLPSTDKVKVGEESESDSIEDSP